jgi:hypothetical protein
MVPVLRCWGRPVRKTGIGLGAAVVGTGSGRVGGLGAPVRGDIGPFGRFGGLGRIVLRYAMRQPPREEQVYAMLT